MRKRVVDLVHVGVTLLPGQNTCVIGGDHRQEQVEGAFDRSDDPICDREGGITIAFGGAQDQSRNGVQESGGENHDKCGALDHAQELHAGAAPELRYLGGPTMLDSRGDLDDRLGLFRRILGDLA